MSNIQPQIPRDINKEPSQDLHIIHRSPSNNAQSKAINNVLKSTHLGTPLEAEKMGQPPSVALIRLPNQDSAQTSVSLLPSQSKMKTPDAVVSRGSIQEPSTSFPPSLPLPVSGASPIIPSTPLSSSVKPQVQVAKKMDQVAAGFFTKLRGAEGFSWGLSKSSVGWSLVKDSPFIIHTLITGIPTYLTVYEQILRVQTPNKIKAAEASVQKHIKDPEFLEFSRFIRTLLKEGLTETITVELNKAIKDLNIGVLKNVVIKRELCGELVDLLLVNAFADLAATLDKSKNEIPNYDKQTALANFFGLISNKINKHVHAEKLREIENAPHQADKLYHIYKGRMVKPETKAEELLAKLTIHDDKGLFPDVKASEKILFELFPDYKKFTSKEVNEIIQMIAYGRKRQELVGIFKNVTHEILAVLFPHKLKNITLPFSETNIAQNSRLQDKLFELIGELLNQFLVQTYLPMASNPARTEIWEGEIQKHIGKHDIKPLMEAPTLFITELAKSYVQTSPKAVDLIRWVLDKALTPSPEKPILSSNKQNLDVSNLSNQYLANWLLESMRNILNTQDATLLSTGAFFKSSLADLTLGLISKGTALAIPQGKKIVPNAFIKEIIEKSLEKFKSMSLQELPTAEFWKDFVNDLPLPVFVKDILVARLVEQSANLQMLAKKMTSAEESIKAGLQEISSQVEKQANGKQLIKLSDQISDEIVLQLLNKMKSLESIDTTWLEAALDELFSQYLPGLKIDFSLKEWFKANIGTLTAGIQQVSSSSKDLIKDGVKTLLLNSFLKIIEDNKGTTATFTTLVVQNLHGTFLKALGHLSSSEKTALNEAVVIQSTLKMQIVTKENNGKKLEKAKQNLVEFGKKYPVEKRVLDDVIRLTDKQTKILKYVNGLEAKLMENIKNAPMGWNLNKLQRLKEAQQIEGQVRPSLLLRKKEEALKPEKMTREQIEEVNERVARYDILIELDRLSPQEKSLVEEYFKLEQLVPTGRLEQARIDEELRNARIKLKSPLGKNEERDTAIQEMENLLQLKMTVDHLEDLISKTEEELDTKLKPFQNLSNGFADIFGLGQKDKSSIPASIREEIWPQIESAKNKMIPRLLFEQVYPMLLLILDIEKNKQLLNEKTGSPLLGNLASAISHEVFSQIPKLLEKIPKEMEEAVNVPSSVLSDLQGLLIPQLKALDKDQALKETKETLQKFIEGVLLKAFLQIAEKKNDNVPIFDKISQEITHLIRTQELSADKIAEKIIVNVLGISAPDHLPGIPPALRELVFQKIMEQSKEQLGPYVQILLDKNKDKKELENISKTPYLGDLCHAISHDAIPFITNLHPSQSIVESIVEMVPRLKGKTENLLIEELQKITSLDKGSNKHFHALVADCIESFLVKAFLNIARKNQSTQPNKDVMVVMIEKLMGVMGDNLGSIRREFSEIEKLQRGGNTQENERAISLAKQKAMAKMLPPMVSTVLKEVFGIDKEDSKAFEGIPAPLREVVFDLFNNQVSNLLNGMIMASYDQLKTLEPSDQQVQKAHRDLGQLFGESVVDVVFQDVGKMAIDATFTKLNDKIGNHTNGVVIIGQSVKRYLEELARGNMKLAEVLLKYGGGAELDRIMGEKLAAGKALSEPTKAIAASMIANGLMVPANAAIQKALASDTEKMNQKLAVNMMKATARHLKLVNLAKAYAMKTRGTEAFTHSDFVAAAKRAGLPEGEGLHPAVPEAKPDFQASITEISKILKFNLNEKQKNDLKALLDNLSSKHFDKTQTLTTDLLIKEFEQIFPLGESSNLLREADKLGAIREIILKEAEAPIQLRIKKMYDPVMRKFLKVCFPNGRNDLSFVPSELRGVVWKQVEDQGHILLSTMIETLLEPDTVTTMLTASLETMRDNFRKGPGPVDLTPPAPELTALDQACGEMLLQVIDIAKMPTWIVNLLKDKKGGISKDMMQTMGQVMREQFNGTFLKTNIKKAFEKVAERDQTTGKGVLAHDTREQSIREKALEKERVEREEKLNKLIPELASVTLDYQLQSQLKTMEAKLEKNIDSLVGNRLGKVGAVIKSALWGVCSFFLRGLVGLVGNISMMRIPFTDMRVRDYAFKIAKLDEMKKNFLDVLRRVPGDQPGAYRHPVYNEHLTMALLDGMIDAFENPDFMSR